MTRACQSQSAAALFQAEDGSETQIVWSQRKVGNDVAQVVAQREMNAGGGDFPAGAGEERLQAP